MGQLIGSLIRHALTLLSGYLVANGVDITPDITEAIVGGATAISTVVWSALQKKGVVKF